MNALRLMAGSIWSPGETFREIRETNARGWIPIVFHILFGVLVIAALVSQVDLAEVLLAQAAQQGSTLPQEQQEAAAQFLNSPVVAWALRALPVIFVPLMFLVVAGIYFCMFLIFGSRASYSQYLSLLAFAYTPQLLSSCVLIALAFVSRPTSLDPGMLGGVSPAIFMTLEPGAATPGPLYAAASSFNLFTIWVLVLLVIAYKGLVSKHASTLAVTAGVLIPWLVYVTFKIGRAAVFS